jgi:hypothetical protein
MHGPNFTQPTPELIDGEEEYSIEKILDSQRFSRRWQLQYLVKWEGYPDLDNMWVDKDDMFTDDKIREFKISNPESETHIRSTSIAKFLHSSAPTHSHLLQQHALCHMSSDGNNDLAYEYPISAIADSPVPFSQENSNATPIPTSAIPVVNFTTLQPLSPAAPVFSPRPVTASSSASNVAAMFRQLQVHTPAPLTPDGQRVTNQAAEMFSVSLTPARGRGHEAGSVMASSTAIGSTASLGAEVTMTSASRPDPYDSSTNNDLRRCARYGEQREYCHGHTPIVPNPTLNLPPRIPVQ